MGKNKMDWAYVCIFIATLIIMLFTILYIVYFSNYIKIPDCYIYNKVGIYCTGCGATRAVYSIYNGEIIKSIYYNPIILYIIVIDFWYLITEGIAKILKKENKFFIKNIKIYLYGASIILVVNWIIKLIMLFSEIKL